MGWWYLYAGAAAAAAGAVAVAVGACADGVAAELGLLVIIIVVLHGGLVPLDVLCVFLLVRLVLGVRLAEASLGWLLPSWDATCCHMQ